MKPDFTGCTNGKQSLGKNFTFLQLQQILKNTFMLFTEGKQIQTRMWVNAQLDGRPAEHRWRPLFNAAAAASSI